MESTHKSKFFDPQLDNLKEYIKLNIFLDKKKIYRNIITETLLGLKDEYDDPVNDKENNEEEIDITNCYDLSYYQIGDKYSILIYYLALYSIIYKGTRDIDWSPYERK